jgi:protein-arginine kinase activator protein McsA
MKGFVDKTLLELKTNLTISSQPLVKMLVESIDKSIVLGESNESIYKNLKNGLHTINKNLKSKTVSSLLEQFNKLEITPDSRTHEIAKKVNLSKKLEAISTSKFGSTPAIKTQIELFESHLNNGTPDFALCESFIQVFSNHTYDSIIKSQVEKVKKYLVENKSNLLLLNSIYTLDSMSNSQYSNVSLDLKNMLINESYTSDILKLKYGNSVPLINQLISDLRIVESEKTGYFTLGEGDSFTKVTNLITPATKAKDGIILYMDNRFVSIRESRGLTGKETNIYIDDTFKIAEIDPAYVKEKFPKFYSVAESFATLGFTKNIDGTSVDSSAIRNFNISFRSNKDKELDLYLNESKVSNINEINLSEALTLESNDIKRKVITLFENSNNLFNFDFIKELSNDRTLSEALVLKLNDQFYVCEKLNSAEREWKKVNEFQLYEFCMTKFNYDISPIFKTKIDEKLEIYKKVEDRKNKISIDITKLEETMEKLQAAISNPDLDSTAIKKLTGIRESIESSIISLKNDYVGLDLFKKEVK